MDDYGVLGDQLDERTEPLVTPETDAPLNPEFFETAADKTFAWCDDLFEAAADDRLRHYDEWFATAADRAGVDHPGEQVVSDLVDTRLDEQERPTPPTNGELTITSECHVNPDISLSTTDTLPSPTGLHEQLFAPRSDGTTALFEALDTVAAESATPGAARQQLLDSGVWALDGAYARLCIAAVAGDRAATWDLLHTTHSLGGQTQLTLNSSLEDIKTGPIAVLAVADVTPTLEIEIDADFVDSYKSTRRRRFLRHLARLTLGVNVRLVGSQLAIRKLLRHHDDLIPASVRDDAQRRLSGGDTSLTAATAQDAVEAIDDLGTDNPAWDVLTAIAQTASERRSYGSLYADSAFTVSDDGIRQRLKRLRDVGLIESTSVNGSKHAVLTPIGSAAIEKHPELSVDDSLSSDCGWPTEHIEQTESQDSGPSDAAVSDPRTASNSTVLSQRAREGRDRPGQSTTPATHSAAPSASFLSLSDHHATAAAASDGHFALLEREFPDLDSTHDRRVPRYSYDESRDELVVSVDYSPTMALTAVRLCAALLSDPAFEQILTPDRLANDPDGQGLNGLDIDNPYVLRGASCVGYLRDVDVDATRFRNRLQQAKQDLLVMTGELVSDDGLDEDVASDILQNAHGLMGTVLWVYDLLGVDVVREIRFPDGAPTDPEYQAPLRKFVATATSIGSRYGAYSGYRVLHENRERKRDDLISEPAVDHTNPDGTLLGSWVFTGSDASALRPILSESPADLDLQDGKEKFAPFRLAGRVVDGNRRQAFGETVTRLLSFKDGLRPNRDAISVLAALTSDIVAAGEAIMALRGEDQDTLAEYYDGSGSRELDLQDIRYGLSQISHDDILPELGGTVVSKVIHTLLDAQTPLSTATLADRAGCSTRGIAADANEQVFAELEAMGLLDRTDLGAGKATEWRLTLCFRDERLDEDAPLPALLSSDTGALDGQRLSDAVFDVFCTAADDYGIEYEFDFADGVFFAAVSGPPSDRDLSPFLAAYPRVGRRVRLIATLLAAEEQLSSSEDIVYGRSPDPAQVTLQTAVG